MRFLYLLSALLLVETISSAEGKGVRQFKNFFDEQDIHDLLSSSFQHDVYQHVANLKTSQMDALQQQFKGKESCLADPIVRIKTMSESTDKHQDHRITQEGAPIVDGDVGFVFLNSNPDAAFVHGDEEVLPEAGKLVVFNGRIPHNTVVPSGSVVRIAGPFYLQTLEPIGGIPIVPTPPPTFPPTPEPTSQPTSGPTLEPTVEATFEPTAGPEVCVCGPPGTTCPKAEVCEDGVVGVNDGACTCKVNDGGDPHFKLWNGTRYSFHGECDLLLLENKDFGHGAGIEMQIRTTVRTFYSYIEAVALKIGDSILEVRTDKFWIDGNEGSDDHLPASLSGYTLHPRSMENDGKLKVYKIDLNNGDFLRIRAYKFLISIDIAGHDMADFEAMRGLHGHRMTGTMLDREGTTVINDVNDFGFEWQVRPDTDQQLFLEQRAPIYPAQCNMPSESQKERHLSDALRGGLMVEAKRVCAHKSPEDFDFCIQDVLATGDVGIAHAW